MLLFEQYKTVWIVNSVNCEQCKKCQQCIARCYLYLWLYFFNSNLSTSNWDQQHLGFLPTVLSVSSCSSVIVKDLFVVNLCLCLGVLSCQADFEAGIVPPSSSPGFGAISCWFILVSVPGNYDNLHWWCLASYLVVNFIPLRSAVLGSETVNESPRVEIELLNQLMANLYSSPGPTCTRGDNSVNENLVISAIIVIN